MSSAAKASAPKAAELISAIPVQEMRRSRSSGSGAGGRLCTFRALWGGKPSDGRAAVTEVLAMVTEQAAHLVPTKADAGRAAAR